MFIAVCLKKVWICGYPLSAQWGLWSESFGFYVAAHKYYCCCPHVNRQHLSTCLGMLKIVVDLHVGNNNFDQLRIHAFWSGLCLYLHQEKMVRFKLQVVFLLTVPQYFLCCSSWFVRPWCYMWRLFGLYLFFTLFLLVGRAMRPNCIFSYFSWLLDIVEYQTPLRPKVYAWSVLILRICPEDTLSHREAPFVRSAYSTTFTYCACRGFFMGLLLANINVIWRLFPCVASWSIIFRNFSDKSNVSSRKE